MSIGTVAINFIIVAVDIKVIVIMSIIVVFIIVICCILPFPCLPEEHMDCITIFISFLLSLSVKMSSQITHYDNQNTFQWEIHSP